MNKKPKEAIQFLREPIITLDKGLETSKKYSSFDVKVSIPFRLDLTTWALRRDQIILWIDWLTKAGGVF
jgi:hypothetical protein